MKPSGGSVTGDDVNEPATNVPDSAVQALKEIAERQVAAALQCRCLWRGERCTNQATQEDGLCNWCGNGRTVEQQRNDPKAVVGPDGEFFGIGGGGQLHDTRYPGETPAACWYPDSGRQVI